MTSNKENILFLYVFIPLFFRVYVSDNVYFKVTNIQPSAKPCTATVSDAVTNDYWVEKSVSTSTKVRAPGLGRKWGAVWQAFACELWKHFRLSQLITF